MNARRYPRTAGEAFKDATYAGAIHRYGKTYGQQARDIAFGLAMALVVALVIYAGLRGWIFGGVAP